MFECLTALSKLNGFTTQEPSVDLCVYGVPEHLLFSLQYHPSPIGQLHSSHSAAALQVVLSHGGSSSPLLTQLLLRLLDLVHTHQTCP